MPTPTAMMKANSWMGRARSVAASEWADKLAKGQGTPTLPWSFDLLWSCRSPGIDMPGAASMPEQTVITGPLGPSEIM